MPLGSVAMSGGHDGGWLRRKILLSQSIPLTVTRDSPPSLLVDGKDGMSFTG